MASRGEHKAVLDLLVIAGADISLRNNVRRCTLSLPTHLTAAYPALRLLFGLPFSPRLLTLVRVLGSVDGTQAGQSAFDVGKEVYPAILSVRPSLIQFLPSVRDPGPLRC